MPITRDTVNIPLESLSPLSRSLFRLDVFTYQLRLLFTRGPETWDEAVNSITVRVINRMINIQGPVYDDMMMFEPAAGSLLSNWRIIFDNFFFMKGFIDALVQLRFVSVNPITIYYHLLSEESKKGSSEGGGQPGIRMSRPLLRRNIPTKIKPKGGVIPDDSILYEKRVEMDTVYTFTRPNYSDGHVMIQRDKEYYENVTYHCGSQAEGFVDDEIPANIPIVEDQDHLRGVLVNLFPKFPFYAFNYRNLYPKMADINRFIESGLQVVFLTTVEGKTLKSVEEEYMRFFQDWGIPVIDYVRADRLNFANMECLVPPAENVDGMKFVNIPNFFVIQRPLDKFHNSNWMGINTERRRGLAGIPWAKDPHNGADLASPQPDDGFLDYFVQEGVRRRLRGKLSHQIFFPLCTIHTPGEVRRVIQKMEKALKRSLKFYTYEANNVMGMYLRSVGEWVLVRAVLRKYL